MSIFTPRDQTIICTGCHRGRAYDDEALRPGPNEEKHICLTMIESSHNSTHFTPGSLNHHDQSQPSIRPLSPGLSSAPTRAAPQSEPSDMASAQAGTRPSVLGAQEPYVLLPRCYGAQMLTVADFIAMIGEYVGTVLFMIFALGGTK